MRASVMLFSGIGIQDAWKDLEYCVRTGQPAFRRTDPDGDAFFGLQSDPEQQAIFDEAMATFAPTTSAAVAAAYDFSQYGTIADIGGGKRRATHRNHEGESESARNRIRPPASRRSREEKKSRRKGCLRDAISSRETSSKEVPRGADAYLLKHVIPRLERRTVCGDSQELPSRDGP